MESKEKREREREEVIRIKNNKKRKGDSWCERKGWVKVKREKNLKNSSKVNRRRKLLDTFLF